MIHSFMWEMKTSRATQAYGRKSLNHYHYYYFIIADLFFVDNVR